MHKLLEHLVPLGGRMMLYWSRALVASACLSLPFYGATAEMPKQRQAKGTTSPQADKTPVSAKTDWRQLRLGGERKIKAIRLTMRRPSGVGHLPTIESTDPKLLERTALGLEFAQRLVSSEWQEGGPGTDAFAEMEIVASDGIVRIAVGDGFGLNGATAYPQNTFVSWMLARIVDDLQSSQSGKPLSNERFDELSGEALIDRQRQMAMNR